MNATVGLPYPELSCGRFAYAFGAKNDVRLAADGKFAEATTISNEDAAYMKDLDGERYGWIDAYTDEALFSACGVRVAFTERRGGCSSKPYHSLNLKYGLGDDSSCVARNRAALFSAFEFSRSGAAVFTPHQVHGTNIAEILSLDDLLQAKKGKSSRFREQRISHWVDVVDIFEEPETEEGSDAALVATENVAALLCFADCLPLILVAPTGAFCVIHCGWKGTIAHLAATAATRLAEITTCDPASFNAYIGAYIHRECFEVSGELSMNFAKEFNKEVSYMDTSTSKWHVDLGACVRHDLLTCGIDAQRIADINKCTLCCNDDFFSYRAADGQCGRHAAFALLER